MSTPITRRGFCFLGGASALFPGMALAQAAPEPDAHVGRASTARWDWLANTYWYVPAANLRAYVYTASNQKLSYVTDQTVFQITAYVRGYFWGVIGAKLGDNAITYKSLVGSVTPEGRVYLSFTPFDPNEHSTVTLGLGVMERKLGQWLMANQMSTGPGARLAVFHWAYMARTEPGRRSWASLPGVGMSVPEFMQDCPPGPKLQVGG
jgi:hypothetical protein